ncbi:MAG: hypothetical protein OHK0021_07460 [Bryobacter sp.]
MKLKYGFSLFVCGMVLLLSGCGLERIGEWGDSQRHKEDFHFTHALKSGGTIELQTFNGGVEIIAWEKEEIDISGVKYAATPEKLEQVDIEVDSSPDAIRIRTIRPEGQRCPCGAKYILRVPKRVELRKIVATNGSLKTTGLEGMAVLETSNGKIEMSRHIGEARLRTSNASIIINGLRGDFVGKTSNGPIRVSDLEGSFSADTSNASIEADIRKLPGGRPVRAYSSNGGLELRLPDYKDQPLELDTSNAGIKLSLPAGANAEIRASTSNSSIQSDFEIEPIGEAKKGRLNGHLGKGGATIRLHTSNGGIQIRRL